MHAAYPSPQAIEAAGMQQLLSWQRFLPSPNDEQRPRLERIMARLAAMREQDPDGYVKASKAVGHG